MKKKYENIFFFCGLLFLGIMVSRLHFAEVWEGLRHAGYWFGAVVVLWFFLYGINTSTWFLIIRSQPPTAGALQSKVSFGYLYKLTISGFALNYATPAGLMGGEPYRIMALAPKIGTERATSSDILYAMTHIFSHFWFWLFAIFLYILCKPVTLTMGCLLAAVGLFCALAIWFFLTGYRKGLAVKGMQLLGHLPIFKNKIQQFTEKHLEQLETIDRQIAALHEQNPKTFTVSVLLELCCRIASALEIYFILLVVNPHASYIDSILILAFTSLVANLLFFMPLQLGGREGGFLLSTTGLSMSSSDGIFVALLVRLRELIWVGIGLLLIKIEQRKSQK